MRIVLVIFILTIIFSFSHAKAFSSDYVLPYPQSMPGSVFYRLDSLQEKVNSIWWFGDFAQFKHNLYYSDKYLVEGKTLFEYKQYLLATDAILKSDWYFNKSWQSLEKAKKKYKPYSEKTKKLSSAAEKHIEVLKNVMEDLPPKYIWSPETGKSTTLEIFELIDNSVRIRQIAL